MRREGAPDLDAVTCVVRLDQHDLHRVEDGARPGSGRHAGKIERTGRCEHQGCGRPSDLDAGFAMADIDQAVRDLRVERIETARDVILLSRRRHELPLVGTEAERSEEHTSELQSLMRITYAVFCLKKNNNKPYTYLKTDNTNKNKYNK